MQNQNLTPNNSQVVNVSPSTLATVAQYCGASKGAMTDQVNAIIDQAFPQPEVAEKFKEDFAQADGWDKKMKLILYILFARRNNFGEEYGDVVYFPEKVIDNKFVTPYEGMIPGLAYYQLIGHHDKIEWAVKNKTKRSDNLIEELGSERFFNDPRFAKSVEKESQAVSNLQKALKFINVDPKDPCYHTKDAMKEAAEVIKYWVNGKNTKDKVVLISRAGFDVLSAIADKYPGFAEAFDLKVVEANPNDIRFFYPEMGVQELNIISQVLKSLNPDDKATPLQIVEDGDGYFRAIFDEDTKHKTITFEPRGAGCEGHVARLANGDYLQPIKVATAASQVGMAPDDDFVDLSSAGALAYYLATYSLTAVGGRSNPTAKGSNLDNNGSNRIGEDIYRAIESAVEKEDPEYLLTQGSHRDDVQRYYFTEMINWFAGSHFRCQNGKLKWLNTLNGDPAARMNIHKAKLGEQGQTKQVKVQGIDKSQVISHLVNQGWILSTKNNTCISQDLMMLHGAELSKDEMKALLLSLDKKGKKAIYERLAKDLSGHTNPNWKSFIEECGGEEAVAEVVADEYKDKVVFMYSDKGGNKGVDRIRNLFALVEKLHPITQAPAGFSFPLSSFEQNTVVAARSIKTSQLIAFGDGSGLRMPLPNGNRSPIIAIGEKESVHDFNIPKAVYDALDGNAIAEMVDLKVFSEAGEDTSGGSFRVDYNLEVETDGSAAGELPVGKGEVIAALNINGTLFDVASTQNGYVVGLEVYPTEDFGTPRLRVKVKYQTVETVFKGRGPIKATFAETNLEGRQELLQLNDNQDDLQAEFVITQTENKSLDIAYNGLPEFGCTLANNRANYDNLSESAKTINDEMARLAADFNEQAGYGRIEDKVILDKKAVAQNLHAPLIDFLNRTFGKAVWFTPYQHSEITESLFTTFTEGYGDEDRYEEVTTVPEELAGKQDLHVFTLKGDNDIADDKTTIVAFYTEGGERRFAQRVYSWVGDSEVGDFFVPTGVEKSTVKDAVGITNYTPTVVRNVARHSKSLAREMLVGAERHAQVYNILSACYRANKALNVQDDVYEDVADGPSKAINVGSDDLLRSKVEEAVFVDGEFDIGASKDLIETLALDPEVGNKFFKLPNNGNNMSVINLRGVYEVDANKSNEASDGLGGLVKEYLLALVSDDTKIANPNGEHLRLLASRIRSMLNAYCEGSSFQKLPFKADSAFNTRPVVGPDCATDEVHILVSEDADSAWQMWLKHIRQRRNDLRRQGKTEAVQAINKYLREPYVAFGFANRNPLAYTPFVNIHPVFAYEDGQYKLERDGTLTKLTYGLNKYQFKASHWLYMATRGDADGDLLSLYWADHHRDAIDVTTRDDVVNSLNESTGTDNLRDLDHSDYWMDFTDIKGRQKDGLTGIAGMFQDEFELESSRTIGQWTTGVGLAYAQWNFQQTMLEMLEVLPGEMFNAVSDEDSFLNSVRPVDGCKELDTVSAEAYELQLSNYEEEAWNFSYRLLGTAMFNPFQTAVDIDYDAFGALGVNTKYTEAYNESVRLYAYGRCVFDERTVKADSTTIDMGIEQACKDLALNKMELVATLLGVFSHMGQQAKLQLGEFGKKDAPKEHRDRFGNVPAHVKALRWIYDNFGPGDPAEVELGTDKAIVEQLNQSVSYAWLTKIIDNCIEAFEGKAPLIEFSVFDWDNGEDDFDEESSPDKGPDNDNEGGDESPEAMKEEIQEILNGLNEGQRQAVQNVINGQSTRILGEGGTGKSFVFDACRRVAKLTGATVLDSAVTGNAADNAQCNFGTVNYMLGLKLGSESFVPKGVQEDSQSENTRENIVSILQNKKVKDRFNVKGPVWVFIDEAEAMSAEDLLLVQQAVQEVAGSLNKDVKFLLAGDPGQFAPVDGHRPSCKPVYQLTKNESIGNNPSQMNRLGYEYDKDTHTLTGPCPHDAMGVETIYLTEKIRQQDEQFGYDLMLARWGFVGPSIWQRFDASFQSEAPEEAINFYHYNKNVQEQKSRLLEQRKQEGYPTKVYNADISIQSSVVKIGDREFELDITNKAQREGKENFQVPVVSDGKTMFFSYQDLNMVKDVREQPSIEIYEGETMVITRNLKPADVSKIEWGENAVKQVLIAGNGSTVTVTELGDKHVRVRKHLDGTEFNLSQMSVRHANSKYMVFKQLPLEAAEAAITSHRAQGRTETRPVVINPSTNRVNEAYVQLSRAKSVDQIWFDTKNGNRKGAFHKLLSAVRNVDSEALEQCQRFDKKYIADVEGDAVHLRDETVEVTDDGYFLVDFTITTKPTPKKAPKQFDIIVGFPEADAKAGNMTAENLLSAAYDAQGEPDESYDLEASYIALVIDLIKEWVEDHWGFDEGDSGSNEGPSDDNNGDGNEPVEEPSLYQQAKDAESTYLEQVGTSNEDTLLALADDYKDKLWAYVQSLVEEGEATVELEGNTCRVWYDGQWFEGSEYSQVTGEAIRLPDKFDVDQGAFYYSPDGSTGCLKDLIYEGDPEQGFTDWMANGRFVIGSPSHTKEQEEEEPMKSVTEMSINELLDYVDTIEGEQKLMDSSEARQVQDYWHNQTIVLAKDIIQWSTDQMEEIIKVFNGIKESEIQQGAIEEDAVGVASDIIQQLFGELGDNHPVIQRFYTSLASKVCGIEIPQMTDGVYKRFRKLWNSDNFKFHDDTSDPSCFPLGVEFGYANHFRDQWVPSLENWTPLFPSGVLEVYKAVEAIWNFTRNWDVVSLLKWHSNHFYQELGQEALSFLSEQKEAETEQQEEEEPMTEREEYEYLQQRYAELEEKLSHDEIDQDQMDVNQRDVVDKANEILLSRSTTDHKVKVINRKNGKDLLYVDGELISSRRDFDSIPGREEGAALVAYKKGGQEHLVTNCQDFFDIGYSDTSLILETSYEDLMSKIPMQGTIEITEELDGRYFYTGVGSTSTPKDVQAQMTKIAEHLAERGYTLRSGGASGADTAFEQGAGDKQIFYPNDKTNQVYYVDEKEECQYDSKLWKRAQEIAKKVHPNPGALGSKGWKLHTRNVFQVFGPDLNTPADFLVCWTKGGKKEGGTRTAIVLAEQHNIPVYNLAVDEFPMDLENQDEESSAIEGDQPAMLNDYSTEDLLKEVEGRLKGQDEEVDALLQQLANKLSEPQQEATEEPEPEPEPEPEQGQAPYRFYTDGACSGNGKENAPGGWGIVIYRNGKEIHHTGCHEPGTTNNRCELEAVIESLKIINDELDEDDQVEIYTDSSYVKDGLTQWMWRWAKKNWEVNKANLDLWKEAYQEYNMARDRVTIHHIRGHAGHEGNEEADKLAQAYRDQGKQ